METTKRVGFSVSCLGITWRSMVLITYLVTVVIAQVLSKVTVVVDLISGL